MKKVITIVLINLLLIPILVMAKDICEEDKIIIKDIDLKKSTETAKELSDPVIENTKVKLDLNFGELGDEFTYDVLIKNTSDEDYEVTEDSFKSDSSYISYSLSYDDNKKIIKPNEEKQVQLRVKYTNKVENTKFENGAYTESKNMNLNLTNEVVEVSNPETDFNYLLYIFIGLFIVDAIVITVLKNKSLNKELTYVIIGLLLIVPLQAFALCRCELKFDTKITIEIPKSMACVYYGPGSCRPTDYTRFNKKYIEFNKDEILSEWMNRLDVTSWYNDVSSDLLPSIPYFVPNSVQACQQNLLDNLPVDNFSSKMEECYENKIIYDETAPVKDFTQGCYDLTHGVFC